MTKQIMSLFLLAGLAMLSGCTSFWQLGQTYDSRDGVSSSLVDYLYPKGEIPPEQSGQIPRLELPLRVGIAFVPPTRTYESAISEATKNDLLEEVRQSFIGRDYIENIHIIPDTYLRSSSGFTGLQQVARLYGVDVMALVSYDQVSASEDRKSSFLYWTIVGAYLVKGTDNEVQTFVDTAVFDVATRSLLFRAPGTDSLSVRSTGIEASEAVRKGRNASFAAAMEDMIGNLSAELDSFEIRVKENPALAEVSRRGIGLGGGGAVAPALLLILLVLRMRRRIAI